MDPLAHLNDDDLAVQASEGSRRAFEGLVLRYGAAVLSVVEEQVGDHHVAQDVAQDVWLKVFRALVRYQPRGAFQQAGCCKAFHGGFRQLQVQITG